jgi:hypothetical protein
VAEYTYLVGTEAMEHAAREFGGHVDRLDRVIQSMGYLLEQHREWADNWIVQVKAMTDVQET